MKTEVTITLWDDDPEARPGNGALVEPVVPALEAALLGARRRLRPAPGGGYAVADDPVPLFTLPGGRTDAVVTGAPLVPRLRRDLAAAGHPVRVVDRRAVPPEFVADRSFLFRADPMARDGLARAADGLFGRFEVEDYATAGWVGWLARLFPAAPVGVGVATRRDARRVADELTGRFGVPARVRNRPGPAAGGLVRVRVVPHAALAALAGQGAMVLVLADAHRAVADANFEQLERAFPFARRAYGLVPPGLRPDPLAAARLALVTGDLLDSDVYRGRPPEVTVYFARSAGGRVRRTDDARARNEAAYWHNAERNRRVVELAKAVAAGDASTLNRLGVDGATLVTPGCDGVAVVAGSAAQAEHLGRLLGWPVRTAVPGAADTKVSGGNAVVTAAYAAEHDLAADVIVRADGGHGPLAVPGLTRAGSGEKVVVDLDDRFDGAARDDARRRIDGYRRQGFRVMTGPHTETHSEQRA